MRDMHWWVYTEDFNGKKIEKYDIFRHSSFSDDVRKAYKKHRNDHDSFCESVRKSLAYYFWSKCEWETVVTSWVRPGYVKPVKIDVYDQVIMNWDVFIEYVWNMAHERKRRGE